MRTADAPAPFPQHETDPDEHHARADEELDHHDIVDAVAARRGIVDGAQKLELPPGAFEEVVLRHRYVLRELKERADEERRVERVAVHLAVDAAVAVED